MRWIFTLCFAWSACAQLPVVPSGFNFPPSASVTIPNQVLLVDVTLNVTNSSGTSPPANNDVVGGWGDQSGHGFHLIRRPVSAPTYSTTGGPSGGPCVVFSSVAGQALTNATLGVTFSQPNTFFLVIKRTPSGTGGAYINGYANNNTQMNDGGDGYHYFAGGSDSGAQAVGVPNWNMLTIVFNGASSTVRTNGVADTEPNMSVVGTGNCSGITLGNFFNYTAPGKCSLCYLAWCTNLTTTATIHSIEQKIGAEFGVTVF